MNDDFGVRAGPETVPFCFKFLAQGLEVVNLAVQNDPNRFVLVADRLVTMLDVNDAEAAHGQPYRTRDVVALVVRATMHHDLAHPLERLALRSFGLFCVQYPANAAHRVFPADSDGLGLLRAQLFKDF